MGIQNVTALGKVFNLTNLADFAGHAAVAVGMTVGGGGGSQDHAKRERGHHGLVSTNQGVDFTLGPEGVKITLE